MASARNSLDAFLRSDAVGSHAVGKTSYLFLSYGDNDVDAANVTSAFRARLLARVNAMKLPIETLERMHFGAQRASAIPGISPVLAQWSTPINMIQVHLDATRLRQMWISRLDGRYVRCTWLAEDQVLAPLVDAGSGCTPINKTKYAGKTIVVRSDGCSQDEAVKNGGQIVVAANGTLPSIVAAGCGTDPDQIGPWATTVAYDEGRALLAAIARSPARELNASLFSKRLPGAFAAIDSANTLQEVGWEKYSTLEMLSWSAQYLDFLTALRVKRSQPHYSIPLVGWTGGELNITLPPVSVLRSFSTLEIENELSCSDTEGVMDQSCPEWDHNIYLAVACQPSHRHGLGEPDAPRGELARIITPFRRRIGQFLTPATHLMPLLTDPDRRRCTFSLTNPDPGWVNMFKLRFSGDAATEGAPPVHTTFLFKGGSFDSSYNQNRTLAIAEPPGTVRKVELAVTLSGHNDMEFQASTHTFYVNGESFSTTSEGVAGTDMGCTGGVRQGRVQPNEHGTWYTGRNFWCNGADVPVHHFDVTAAVAKASPVNVTYRATGPGGSSPVSGEIVLTSVLAWWNDQSKNLDPRSLEPSRLMD